MMGRQRSQNNVFGLDDYDQPTEPMARIILPAQTAFPYPAPTGSLPANVPPFQPDLHPGTQEFPPDLYYGEPVYPVLPATPTGSYRAQRGPRSVPAYNAARSRPRRSRIPGLVGLFFVLVQLLLLGRVVCMLLSVGATTPWLTLLFAVSDLFVWPARWLVAHMNTSVLAGTQLLIYLEFLLIIFAYGLVSRLFVRVLKMVLNS